MITLRMPIKGQNVINMIIERISEMESTIIELLSEIKTNTDNKTSSKWLNIKQASQDTSVSESTLRRAVKSGTLRVSKVSGKLLFKIEDLDRWLNG